jgi:hypothetical protein
MHMAIPRAEVLIGDHPMIFVLHDERSYLRWLARNIEKNKAPRRELLQMTAEALIKIALN